MPIEPSIPIAAIGQNEFHEIDKSMLGHAFAIHNQFGRLLDEAVYKAELASRCEADGLPTLREVQIRVRHQHFTKDYFVDLLLCGSTVIEVKTVKELMEAHQGQGLNYLLLAQTNHGSLVNFRTTKVTRKFLSSRLTPEVRRCFDTIHRSWPVGSDYSTLRDLVVSLCSDIGLGLDLPLYREGIAVLAGCSRELVPIISGTNTIGHQEMHLFSPEVGLAVTGLTNLIEYRRHLQRLVANTRLEAIAWINLTLGTVRFEYLKR